MRVQLEHISPTPIGAHGAGPRPTSRRSRADGSIFHVSARDDRGLIAAGKVVRVIVDVERFLDKTR